MKNTLLCLFKKDYFLFLLVLSYFLFPEKYDKNQKNAFIYGNCLQNGVVLWNITPGNPGGVDL